MVMQSLILRFVNFSPSLAIIVFTRSVVYFYYIYTAFGARTM